MKTKGEYYNRSKKIIQDGQWVNIFTVFLDLYCNIQQILFNVKNGERSSIAK